MFCISKVFILLWNTLIIHYLHTCNIYRLKKYLLLPIQNNLYTKQKNVLNRLSGPRGGVGWQ